MNSREKMRLFRRALRSVPGIYRQVLARNPGLYLRTAVREYYELKQARVGKRASAEFHAATPSL